MKMRLSLAYGGVGLAIAMGWVAACEHTSSPSGPTAVTLPPTITALTIRGNGALTAPGQTTQLSAEATLSDGSKTDVTSSARWGTSDGTTARVSSTGLVTAVDLGRATVYASSPDGRRSATFAIIVLPVGTYILEGVVTEAGGLPVANVRLEAVGGPMSGRTVMTDQYGHYAFKGVSGVLQVRATKDGYVAATENVSQITGNVNVELTPTVAYAALGGVYRLTFKASDSCQLPIDASSRVYTASIAQTGAHLMITLSGAQFSSSSGNAIDGRVYGNAVSLTLNGDYYCLSYGTCIAEKLAEMRYLTLIGTAAGTVTGGTISALFAGSVNVIPAANNNNAKPIATCAAPDHHLTFTPTATPSARKRF